jgi:hypothetical protein
MKEALTRGRSSPAPLRQANEVQKHSLSLIEAMHHHNNKAEWEFKEV